MPIQILLIVLLSMLTLILLVGLLFLHIYNPLTKRQYTYVMEKIQIGGNFQKKAFKRGAIDYVYFDNLLNDKPILVFVHGYPQCKESWLPFVFKFSKRYRIIIPDLPGHGENYPNPVEDYEYSLKNLSEFINDLVTSLNITNFHMAGISMGGGITCAYAINHSEKLKSITLLDPAGFNKNEHDSAMVKRMKKWTKYADKRLKLPITPKTISLQHIWLLRNYLFFWRYPIVTPPAFLNYYFKDHVANRFEFCEKVINDFTDWKTGEFKAPLDDEIHKINCPILLVWGKHDKVIDISTVKVFENVFSGKRKNQLQVRKLNCCGHASIIDRPLKTEKVMKQFLNKVLAH